MGKKKHKKKRSLGGKIIRKLGTALIVTAVSACVKKLFEDELERGIIAAVKTSEQE